MMGLGTLANVLAILAGGGLGLLLKGGLPERWQGALMRTMGLAVVFIGAAGAMPGLLRAEGGALAGTGVKDTLGMIFALALGTLVGEWIDLDDKMERLGAWLKAKAGPGGGDSQFVPGLCHRLPHRVHRGHGGGGQPVLFGVHPHLLRGGQPGL